MTGLAANQTLPSKKNLGPSRVPLPVEVALASKPGLTSSSLNIHGIEWVDMNFDLSSPVALSGLKRKEKKRTSIALKSKSSISSGSKVKAVLPQQRSQAEDTTGSRQGNGVERAEQQQGVSVGGADEIAFLSPGLAEARGKQTRAGAADASTSLKAVDSPKALKAAESSEVSGLDAGRTGPSTEGLVGAVRVKKRSASQRRSVGNSSQNSRLPPVEAPPTKVLLAEPLSLRKARLQQSGGKKRGRKAASLSEVEEQEAVAGEEVRESEKVAGDDGDGGDGMAGASKGVSKTAKAAKGGRKKAATNNKTDIPNEQNDGLKVTRASKKKALADGDGKQLNGEKFDTAVSRDEDGDGVSDNPPARAVTSGALTTTTEKNIRTAAGGREPPPSLADLPLDSEGWALKDIVKWGSARERRMAKENAKLAPKPVLPQTAPMQPTPQASLTPKVRVVDGKIVVDEESLTVAAQQKEEYTKVVTEESHTINSMSYVNRLSNDRWSVEDTELFFRALSQFGTDFSLMAMLFPGRMRKHLKKKFCKESKVCPERIDAAMRASAHATLGSYREMIDLLKNSKEIIKNT